MKQNLSRVLFLVFAVSFGWLTIGLPSPCDAADYYRDVAYYPANFPGSGDLEYRAQRCKLDVCVPKSEDYDVNLYPAGEKLPVIVWFHGGGLTGGSKHVPEAFTKAGIITVAVNYRLRTKAKAPDFIEDAAAATAWTFKNIADYGGDVKRIYLSGHSAGGYLTAMVGMAEQYLQTHGLKNTDLAALYPISGQLTTHFNIVADRLAEQGRVKPANFQRDNPIVIDDLAPLYYTDRTIPPIHLLTGDARIEWPARVEENALMAAMLRTVGGHNTVEFVSFPNTNHGSCAEPSYAYICKSIRESK